MLRFVTAALSRADWTFSFSRYWERSLGTILVYHAIDDPAGYAGRPPVTRAQFEGQVALLKERYDLSTLSGLFAGQRANQRKQVVLTFDDAHWTFLARALPVLRAHQVPATIFVCPGLLGTRGVISADDLKMLSALPEIEIGNHTRTHIDLGRDAPPAVMEQEILGGKAELERLIGREVRSFAFPYGRWSRANVDIVRRGHRYAVTCKPGVVRPDSDRLTLSRVVMRGMPLERFAFELTDLRQVFHG